MDGCQYKGKASIIGQFVRKKRQSKTNKQEQVIVLLQELL